MQPQTEKQSDTNTYIPEEYTKKISKIELITEGRKKELESKRVFQIKEPPTLHPHKPTGRRNKRHT